MAINETIISKLKEKIKDESTEKIIEEVLNTVEKGGSPKPAIKKIFKKTK